MTIDHDTTTAGGTDEDAVAPARSPLDDLRADYDPIRYDTAAARSDEDPGADQGADEPVVESSDEYPVATSSEEYPVPDEGAGELVAESSDEYPVAVSSDVEADADADAADDAVVEPELDAEDVYEPMVAPAADETVDEPVAGRDFDQPPVLTPAVPVAASTPTVSDDDVNTRWRELQVAFVDDPREAVEGAGSLVAEMVEVVVASVNAEQDRLGGTWADDTTDTEQLRQALRAYRVFVDRLQALSMGGTDPH